MTLDGKELAWENFSSISGIFFGSVSAASDAGRFSCYTCSMKRASQEWDFPPTRRWRHYPSRFDVYQPDSWGSPIERKIINIWWRVMMVSIKVLLTIALTIMAFGASWLFWTVLTL